MQRKLISTLSLLIVTVTLFSDVANGNGFSECKTPKFKTRYTVFMQENGIGSLAFSLKSSKPSAVEIVTSDTCYKISDKLPSSDGRVFLFMNHRSPLNESHASFLAVDSIKQFKHKIGEEARVTGRRTGVWYRKDERSKDITLEEIQELKAFHKLSPDEFRNIHIAKTFDETKLLNTFKEKYWHGTPDGSDVDSRERLSYWKGANQLYDEHTLTEKHLMRFETVRRGEKPRHYRYGIPVSIRFANSMKSLEVIISTPVDGGWQTFVRFE